MAGTQVLAIGATAASSADYVAAAGTLVALNDSDGAPVANGARVVVEIKDPSGNYFELGTLYTDAAGGNPAWVLRGAGTYRFTRVAGVACGVFAAG